jgi:hypothetical protein
MATGFPASTGDVLSAAMFNGLTAFTIGADKTNDYTLAQNDEYQTLIVMNKGTAVALKIPTDATYNFAIGTCITVYNEGAGTCTISAVTSGTTTIQSVGASATAPTLAQYKSAACIKLAANLWAVVGAIA